VKKHGKRIGLDVDEFSGHSIRAGIAITMAMNGVDLADIAEVTGPRPFDNVHRYIRMGKQRRLSPAEMLGL